MGRGMKTAKIVILLIVLIAVMNWLREGRDFPLPTVLPWLGGDKPGIYDFAALTMVIIAVLGLRRLARRQDDADDRE